MALGFSVPATEPFLTLSVPVLGVGLPDSFLLLTLSFGFAVSFGDAPSSPAGDVVDRRSALSELAAAAWARAC